MNPLLGSFMTRAPLGYYGGLNFYQAVGGEPVGYVDPKGTVRCDSERECERLKNIIDDYRLLVRQARLYAKNMLRDCPPEEVKAGHLVKDFVDVGIQANTVLSTGLSILATTEYAATHFRPHTLTYVRTGGTAFTVVGPGIEAVTFGQAVNRGDKGEAVSSGATIVGGVAGIFVTPIGVATAAGSVGKFGIEKFYEQKSNKIMTEMRARGCRAWKYLFPKYRDKAKALAPAAEAMANVRKLGCEE